MSSVQLNDDPRAGQFHGGVDLRRPIGTGIIVRTAPDATALGSKAMHCHAQPYFWMLLDGDCMERIEGGIERFYRPMEFTFHPTGERHSHFRGERAPRGLGVILPESDLRRVSEFVAVSAGPRVLIGPAISRIAHGFARECDKPDQAADFILEGYCLELIGLMGRKRSVSVDSRPPKWLVRARDVLHDRHADRLRISDVAGEVGIHPVHLGSAFKRHYGVNAGEYLRSIRIDAARSYLANSEWSIAEISAACGFYDQSHFCRVFKTVFGMTPQEFRRHSTDGRSK